MWATIIKTLKYLADFFQVFHYKPSDLTGASGTPQSKNTYGKIRDKVATITDTQYNERLIPIILHYHAVLGPDWPIVLFTSKEVIKNHLDPKSNKTSATWRSAVEDGRVQVRSIPDKFNLTSRYGVNVYLSSPWLWEQLAPAHHALLFQADAILCSNSPHRVDDFLQYDFVGAMMGLESKLYNGGLSLRNRTMMLDILNEGENWERFCKERKTEEQGEDFWFSKLMDKRGGNLPKQKVSAQFALQYGYQIDDYPHPVGYHKLQKNIPQKKIDSIAEWCPEIVLTRKGTLGPK